MTDQHERAVVEYIRAHPLKAAGYVLLPLVLMEWLGPWWGAGAWLVLMYFDSRAR